MKQKRFKITPKKNKIRWWDRKTQTGGYRKNKRGALTKLRNDLKKRRTKTIETPTRKIYRQTPTKITPIQEKIKKFMPEKPITPKIKIKNIKGKPIKSYFKNKVYKRHLTTLKELTTDEKNAYKKLLYQTLKNEKQLDLIIDQIEKNKYYLDYTITINGTVDGQERELVKMKTQNKTFSELKKELRENGISEGNEIDSQTLDSLKLIGQIGGGRNYKIYPTALRDGKRATITDVNLDIEFIRGTI